MLNKRPQSYSILSKHKYESNKCKIKSIKEPCKALSNTNITLAVVAQWIEHWL